MRTDIDWYRLSFVEMASGIEVLITAKLFRDSPKLHKAILLHALDEYNHSKSFYAQAKKHQAFDEIKISTAQALVKLAGLEKSPFPASVKERDDICAYLYLGESRALKFNDDIMTLLKDQSAIDMIKEIQKDEVGHKSGLERYLSNKSKLKTKFSILKYKVKFFFSDKKTNSLFEKFKTKSESLIIFVFTSILFKAFLTFNFSASDTDVSMRNRKDIF
jgi:ferritin-like protein